MGSCASGRFAECSAALTSSFDSNRFPAKKFVGIAYTWKWEGAKCDKLETVPQSHTTISLIFGFQSTFVSWCIVLIEEDFFSMKICLFSPVIVLPIWKFFIARISFTSEKRPQVSADYFNCCLLFRREVKDSRFIQSNKWAYTIFWATHYWELVLLFIFRQH